MLSVNNMTFTLSTHSQRLAELRIVRYLATWGLSSRVAVECKRISEPSILSAAAVAVAVAGVFHLFGSYAFNLFNMSVPHCTKLDNSRSRLRNARSITTNAGLITAIWFYDICKVLCLAFREY